MDSTNITSRGKLGIENAKLLLTAIAAQVFSGATIDADGDGETSTVEWTNFGTKLVLAILGNLTVGRSAFPEFGDIKGPEFGELVQHTLNTDFLPDTKEQAELLVKEVLVMGYVGVKGAGNVQTILQGDRPERSLTEVFAAIIALEAE